MTELSYVALYGLLIVATILAQATLATPQLGLPYLATSRDDGRTWSEPKASSIQNPSARFFLRRLALGNLLLVKNDDTR